MAALPATTPIMVRSERLEGDETKQACHTDGEQVAIAIAVSHKELLKLLSIRIERFGLENPDCDGNSE